MLQRDGVVMVGMKVLVMKKMMMIPMKSGAMVMTMAMISPLRQRRRCLSLSPLPDLGFWG
jgi:hypothetical protein